MEQQEALHQQRQQSQHRLQSQSKLQLQQAHQLQQQQLFLQQQQQQEIEQDYQQKQNNCINFGDNCVPHCASEELCTNLRTSEISLVNNNAFDSENFSKNFNKNFDNYLTSNNRNITVCPPCCIEEIHTKIAGSKIFTTIMVNAWRKRRAEVRKLVSIVNDMKKSSMKTRNQIHVYNTLFRVEQKRNDELTDQLKLSESSINRVKSSCDSLTTTIISLKADKAVLEQELQFKYKEMETLNSVLAQTKSDLFRSMVEQKNLQTTLNTEQKNIQSLENEKNKLIDQILLLGSVSRNTKQKYLMELGSKEIEVKQANDAIEHLEKIVRNLNEKTLALQEYHSNDMVMRSEILLLKQQVHSLQSTLDKTLDKKIQLFWKNLVFYHTITIRAFHLFAYYLLPATPTPENLTIASIFNL